MCSKYHLSARPKYPYEHYPCRQPLKYSPSLFATMVKKPGRNPSVKLHFNNKDSKVTVFSD